MSDSPWDEVPVSEICRYCGKLKDVHIKYGFYWLCPPSFGTSTNYDPVPQFTVFTQEGGPNGRER